MRLRPYLNIMNKLNLNNLIIIFSIIILKCMPTLMICNSHIVVGFFFSLNKSLRKIKGFTFYTVNVRFVFLKKSPFRLAVVGKIQ